MDAQPVWVRPMVTASASRWRCAGTTLVCWMWLSASAAAVTWSKVHECPPVLGAKRWKHWWQALYQTAQVRLEWAYRLGPCGIDWRPKSRVLLVRHNGSHCPANESASVAGAAETAHGASLWLQPGERPDSLHPALMASAESTGLICWPTRRCALIHGLAISFR